MEELWHINIETSSKLQKEIDNLAVLQDSLKRSDVMTKNMLSILDSFESRLGKLEETIIPIYQETGNLQRRHENIDKTLAALDHVIGYYHVAEEVEPVIRDGPGSGLSGYMQCMDKLRKAVQYLTQNNPNSTQLSHVMTLYEAGKDALEKEFRNLLQRHGMPVAAGSLLDVLVLEEDGAEDDVASVPILDQLPEQVLNSLRLIATWLLSCGYETDFMQAYAAVRSQVLVRSLQTLRDHLKSASRDSISVGLSHSPALSAKQKVRETPVRKASTRMAFVRKSSSALKKHSNLREPPGIARQSYALLKEDDLEIDIDFYVTSVKALLRLIQSEAVLMQGIVPEKNQRRIFDQLIQGGLDVIVKEGDTIGQVIHRATTRHSVTAVIHLFPVLRQLRAVKPDFEKVLEGCQAPTRSKLASLISSLDATGAKALEEFIDNIRSDPDKQSYLPKDGTVHELTSNTILFLEQLLDFVDTAGAMLLTQDPTSLPNIQNVDRLKLKLAEFITKVLSSLGLNLNNKAEAYSDPALRAVFMLNNFTYILKSLKRSGMLDVVHLWNDEVKTFYEDQIIIQKRIYSQSSALLSLVRMRLPDIENTYLDLARQHKVNYMQSWSRVLHYISENQKMCSPPNYSPDTKLKEKDKNAIKEKFVGFNREIEEIHRVQRAFAIPDPELRESLREDNKTFIVPYYAAFLKRYRVLNFTKNQEKYIKYSEAQVQYFINDFFDAAS